MNNKKIKTYDKRFVLQVISLILNITIAILEGIGLIMTARQGGWGVLQYYTQDSNIICFIATIICILVTITGLLSGKYGYSQWVLRLKYIATCLVTVTLVVVMFILAPMMPQIGFVALMTSGSSLYLHFLCPALSIINFICFERGQKLIKKDLLYAISPTLLYAVITIILNYMKVLHGPYPFLYVYEQPFYMLFVWFVVIIGGAGLFAWLIKLAHSGRSR